MKTLIVTIENQSENTYIAPIVENFENENLIKNLGYAITFVWQTLNKQYDNPIVKINGIQIENRLIKLMHKKDFLTFRANFPLIREQIAPMFAILQKDVRKEYITHIDTNKILSSQNNFSSTEIAIFAKEQIKKTKFAVSLFKEDAKSSIWTAKELDAYNKKQEAARQKRIEAKKQNQIA